MGVFLKDTRRQYKNDKLSKERIDHLDEPGLVVNPRIGRPDEFVTIHNAETLCRSPHDRTRRGAAAGVAARAIPRVMAHFADWQVPDEVMDDFLMQENLGKLDVIIRHLSLLTMPIESLDFIQRLNKQEMSWLGRHMLGQMCLYADVFQLDDLIEFANELEHLKTLLLVMMEDLIL